jgi:hypothetical protein
MGRIKQFRDRKLSLWQSAVDEVVATKRTRDFKKGDYKKEDLYEDYLQKTTGNSWIDYRDNGRRHGSLTYTWETFIEVHTGLKNEYNTRLI